MKDKIKDAILNGVKDTVLGKTKKKNNNPKGDLASTIIRNHIIWSMGAGFIPILVADIFAVTALQLDMIRQLCKVYDTDFEETRGKALVTSLTSSTLARLGARSLIKLIPGVGSLIGGATVSVFAGASTFALGEVFKAHFESGGTILDFDPERVKQFYKEKFEKGKDVAKDMRGEKGDEFVGFETESDLPMEDNIENFEDKIADVVVEDKVVETAPKDPISQLKELGQLKNDGIITEDEFKTMKAKIIDNI